MSAGFAARIGGQDWHVVSGSQSEAPPGTQHGAEAVCVADDRIVLVSH